MFEYVTIESSESVFFMHIGKDSCCMQAYMCYVHSGKSSEVAKNVYAIHASGWVT